MKSIRIRNLKIGQGAPKIVVSIIEKNHEDIIKKVNSLKEMTLDIVEWRVDFYDDVLDLDCLLDTLKDLRNSLGHIPLLFTFRSAKEGGKKEISTEEYTLLNKEAAKSRNVDLIDLEMFLGHELVKENISNIHREGILVVGSYHNFDETPEKDEMIEKLIKMQDAGADILKIAVMANDTEDVIKLLGASNEMYRKYATRPLVAISMGPRGLISRISGELFGSAMTFASAGQESAPGQIPLDELAHILGIIHKYSYS